MEPKLYVVVDEYEGGYVGTEEQVIDWLIDNGCTHGHQKFYEVGSEVALEFRLVQEED